MFGINSLNIILAFITLFLSTIISIIYGVVTWNRAHILTKKELKQEQAWKKEEDEIDKTISGDVK